MESLRRPSVLAAIAAALLIVNFVVLRGDDTPGVAVDDPVAGEGTEDGSEDGAAEGSGDGAQDSGDGATGGDAGDGGDGANSDGDGGTSTDDGAPGEGEGNGDTPATGDGALTAPAAGTYTYASSGTWSLNGDVDSHELPATATATVTSGDAWEVRLAAGDDYADRFTFRIGADGGLDWTDWVLERDFATQRERSETSYACSGTSAFYRPDESGRVVDHACDSDSGISSAGSVEHIGTEEVTLGDGTTVLADRLLYTYTVSGEGTANGVGFTASGEGRFDFWMDPSTGLRLREVRSITSTTTFDTGSSSTYREEAEFTLESLTPA